MNTMNVFEYEESIGRDLVQEEVGIESFFETIKDIGFNKSFDLKKFNKSMRLAVNRLDNNSELKKYKNKNTPIKKTGEKEYTIFHTFETYFYSWIDVEAPKTFYKQILDINKRVEDGDDITVNIYTAWSEFVWEYQLFAAINGLWFNNLLFNKLKAKKRVFIDTWCNIGSLVAATYADEMILGGFTDVIVSLSPTLNFSAEIQRVLDESKENILKRLTEANLITSAQMNDILDNPGKIGWFNSAQIRENIINSKK